MVRLTDRFPRQLLLAAGLLTGLILLLLWMQGVFRHRVGPEGMPPRAGLPSVRLLTVDWQTVLDWQEAPGVVASRQQPQVAAQAMGRILAIKVAPGEAVRRGQVLAVLDDAELRSRLGQAQEQLAAVEAQFQQAQDDYQRFRGLLERRVVPRREYDQVKARFESLQAQVQQARQAVAEARAQFRYGRVLAPDDGRVAEKLVNVGDLATPGRPLFTIFDPQGMRLEAQVGEQFGPALREGAPVRVAIPSLQWEVDSVIEEVVAQAASASRTFLVKAQLPPHPDLRPGMFGRLFFDGRERSALLVPLSAVRTVGQLETVTVQTAGGPQSRQIRTGRRYGKAVEVLAGLQPGDQIVLPEGAQR